MREEDIENAVKAYLGGDQLAFTKIHAYLSRVINQVMHTKRYPGYMDHLEDLEQECWLDAVKNLPRWDPQRGTLKNFMFRCFSNRMIVYLHRVQNPPNTMQIEEVSDLLPSMLTPPGPQDLDISVVTRIWGDAEEYVIRKVCVAVYLQIFNQARQKIIRELREMTRLSLSRIRFLVDYALVLVRKHSLEVGWKLEILDQQPSAI